MTDRQTNKQKKTQINKVFLDITVNCMKKKHRSPLSIPYGHWFLVDWIHYFSHTHTHQWMVELIWMQFVLPKKWWKEACSKSSKKIYFSYLWNSKIYASCPFFFSQPPSVKKSLFFFSQNSKVDFSFSTLNRNFSHHHLFWSKKNCWKFFSKKNFSAWCWYTIIM